MKMWLDCSREEARLASKNSVSKSPLFPLFFEIRIFATFRFPRKGKAKKLHCKQAYTAILQFSETCILPIMRAHRSDIRHLHSQNLFQRQSCSHGVLQPGSRPEAPSVCIALHTYAHPRAAHPPQSFLRAFRPCKSLLLGPRARI